MAPKPTEKQQEAAHSAEQLNGGDEASRHAAIHELHNQMDALMHPAKGTFDKEHQKELHQVQEATTAALVQEHILPDVHLGGEDLHVVGTTKDQKGLVVTGTLGDGTKELWVLGQDGKFHEGHKIGVNTQADDVDPGLTADQLKVRLTTEAAGHPGERPGSQPNGDSTAGQGSEHTVKQGDTLWHIAQDSLNHRHPGKQATAAEINAEIKQIAKDNHISNPDIIDVGQHLKLRDAQGQLSGDEGPEGNAPHVKKDADGHVIEVDYPGGKSHKFEWANGQMTGMTGLDGSHWKTADGKHWTCDHSGTKFKEKDTSEMTVTVDRNGKFTERDKGNDYDAVMTPEGNWQYNYDDGHNLKTDTAGHVTEVDYPPDGKSSRKFEWTDGHVTGMTDADGSHWKKGEGGTWNCDKSGTRSKEKDVWQGSVDVDASGNCTERRTGDAYSTTNRADGDVAYTYDDDGRTVTKASVDQNQFVEVDYPNGQHYGFEVENNQVTMMEDADHTVWVRQPDGRTYKHLDPSQTDSEGHYKEIGTWSGNIHLDADGRYKFEPAPEAPQPQPQPTPEPTPDS